MLLFPNHGRSRLLHMKYAEVRAYAINNLRTIKDSKYFSTWSFSSGLASFSGYSYSLLPQPSSNYNERIILTKSYLNTAE